MPLDPAAILALAASCAPGVAPETLLAVAQAESGLDPLAIGVNGPGGGPRRSSSRTIAIREAGRLIAAGRNIDLGLGQINSANLRWLGLSIEAAFDPCRNLAASARVLADGYRRANPKSGKEQQALRTALSFYNTGHPERGLRNGYVQRVTRAAVGFVPALRPANIPAEREVVPSPPSPPSWDVFARARPAASGFLITRPEGAPP